MVPNDQRLRTLADTMTARRLREVIDAVGASVADRRRRETLIDGLVEASVSQPECLAGVVDELTGDELALGLSALGEPIAEGEPASRLRGRLRRLFELGTAPPAPRPPDVDGRRLPTPGSAFGDYVIEDVLGKGSFGVTYRARHRDGRVVALKRLLRFEETHGLSAAEYEDAQQRFKHEAAFLLDTRHPNIVEAWEPVTEGGHLAYAMELIPGLPLDEVQGALGNRPFTATEVRRVVSQVLAAVGHAHARGVLHRDLKPENVMIRDATRERPDPGGRAYVLDFGSAHFQAQQKRMTRTLDTLATVEYRSPEAIRTPTQVGPAADVFSIGVIAYELTAGRLPFGDRFTTSPTELMRRIVEGDFPRLVPGPGRDPALVAAIHRALELDPAKRFASCEEFAAALDEAPKPAKSLGFSGNAALATAPEQPIPAYVVADAKPRGEVRPKPAPLPALKAVPKPVPMQWWQGLAWLFFAGVAGVLCVMAGAIPTAMLLALAESNGKRQAVDPFIGVTTTFAIACLLFGPIHRRAMRLVSYDAPPPRISRMLAIFLGILAALGWLVR